MTKDILLGIERKTVAAGQPYSSTAMAIHYARYLLAKELVSGMKVLDIACGEGLGAAQMATQWGAKHVTAVDNSAKAIENAHREFSEISNLSFVASDACEFLKSNEDEFDVIISIETVEHVEDPVQFLSLLKKNLTPAGSLLITCPNDEFYYGPGPSLNKHHKHVFNFDEFRSISESVFGGGEWLLGTKLTGFVALPLGYQSKRARFGTSLLETGATVNNWPAVPVGAPTDKELTTRDSVFFAGIFGSTVASVPTLGVICAGAHFQQNVPGIFRDSKRSSIEEPLNAAIILIDGATCALLDDALTRMDLYRFNLQIMDIGVHDESTSDSLDEHEHYACKFDLLHFVGIEAFRRWLNLIEQRNRRTLRTVRGKATQVWTIAFDQYNIIKSH